MNTWKVILATIVIFGAGVVTGGLLVRNAIPIGFARPQHATSAARPAQPVSAGGMRLEFLHRMQKDLDLTASQRERIDTILRESQERTRNIMEPVAPALREEVQRAKEQFRQVLTAEQQTRFDVLVKRQQHPRDSRRSQPVHERSTALTNAP